MVALLVWESGLRCIINTFVTELGLSINLFMMAANGELS